VLSVLRLVELNPIGSTYTYDALDTISGYIEGTSSACYIEGTSSARYI